MTSKPPYTMRLASNGISASIIALIVALFILAMEQKSEPQQAGGAAPDPYA